MSLAAEIGHEAVVKLVLDSPDIAANLRDESDVTSLSLAAENDQVGCHWRDDMLRQTLKI